MRSSASISGRRPPRASQSIPESGTVLATEERGYPVSSPHPGGWSSNRSSGVRRRVSCSMDCAPVFLTFLALASPDRCTGSCVSMHRTVSSGRRSSGTTSAPRRSARRSRPATAWHDCCGSPATARSRGSQHRSCCGCATTSPTRSHAFGRSRFRRTTCVTISSADIAAMSPTPRGRCCSMSASAAGATSC